MMAARHLISSSPGAPSKPSMGTVGTIVGTSKATSDLPERSGAIPLKPPVVACEVFPPMAQLAPKVVARNGLQDWVRIIPRRSDELTVDSALALSGQTPGSPSASPVHGSSEMQPKEPSAASKRRAELAEKAAAAERVCRLPDRVDVIVSEIFDSQLLGEGLLPTLWDAVPRLLKVGTGFGTTQTLIYLQ